MEETGSVLKGSFTDFQAVKLYSLGEYLTTRSDFSEEQPLIVTSCENSDLLPLENLICCGTAGGGGHAVKLGRLSLNVFEFSLAFLGADYGVYIKSEEGGFICGCLSGKKKEIENFKGEFENFKPSGLYKAGRISGYSGILEKYIKSGKSNGK